MPPAIIGGVIAGVGAIGSAVIGSKAASKAAKAQSEASDKSAEVQHQIYQQNVGYQTPYLNTGNAAMAQINALLGLNVPQSAAPAPPTTTPATGGTTSTLTNAGPFFRNKIAAAWQQKIASGAATIEDAPLFVRSLLGNQQSQTPATQTPATPAVTQPTAQAAFDQFKNYTGYTNRLNQGNNALQSAYAAKGSLQSGAALQAMARMNQDYASNEFGNYMGYLGQQQQLGPGAANALSGVGTNYANAASNIAMQQGDNAANAAIAQGNIWGNAINGIAGAAGGIFGRTSSYSDRRLKTKIKLLKREPDGLGWYEFAYQVEPDTMLEGVMADEVKELRPAAYSEDARGYGMVDYGKLAA